MTYYTTREFLSRLLVGAPQYNLSSRSTGTLYNCRQVNQKLNCDKVNIVNLSQSNFFYNYFSIIFYIYFTSIQLFNKCYVQIRNGLVQPWLAETITHWLVIISRFPFKFWNHQKYFSIRFAVHVPTTMWWVHVIIAHQDYRLFNVH